MYEIYRVKLSDCFTTDGVYYDNSRDHLVLAATLLKIPVDIIEFYTFMKLPFNKREQLGFSANSPIGAAIVDGLHVFADKTPGRQDLINWCIIYNLRGEALAKLIIEIYGDVNKSYFFWNDMLDFIFKCSTPEDLREQLEHRSRKQGTILTSDTEVKDDSG